jgi:hypothetical protein
LRDSKKMLLISFEMVTYGGVLLLVPYAIAGLLVDSLVSDVVAFVVLAAAAGTAVLTAIALREGWFCSTSRIGAPAGKAATLLFPRRQAERRRRRKAGRHLKPESAWFELERFVLQLPAPKRPRRIDRQALPVRGGTPAAPA